MRGIAVALLVASTAAADPAPEPCACGPAAIAAERERLQTELVKLHHDEHYQAWLSRQRLSRSLRRWSYVAMSGGTGALAGFAIYGATHDNSVRFDAGSFPFITAMTLFGAALSLGITASVIDPGPYQPIPPAPVLGGAPRRAVGYAWAF